MFKIMLHGAKSNLNEHGDWYKTNDCHQKTENTK